jgi:glyoxylase I family protein
VTVAEGGAVTLPGIGKVACRARPERQVRNPQTQEMMTKPADKQVKVTIAKALKDPGIARHLGITQPDVAVWMQEAGPTVFSPFRADTDYFAPDRQWMLNLRVDDLPGHDRATARAAGIAVETRTDWDGDGSYGTFARIHDPEGTPIELWQPPG